MRRENGRCHSRSRQLRGPGEQRQPVRIDDHRSWLAKHSSEKIVSDIVGTDSWPDSPPLDATKIFDRPLGHDGRRPSPNHVVCS
jgi:hypothetical protein